MSPGTDATLSVLKPYNGRCVGSLGTLQDISCTASSFIFTTALYVPDHTLTTIVWQILEGRRPPVRIEYA